MTSPQKPGHRFLKAGIAALAAGLETPDQTHFVHAARGVGMRGPQMRFCCPPEATLLAIHSA